MKIVTWNCNLNFATKFEHLESIDADVYIIQECENLKENYFPGSKFFWTGRIENKGLGVLIKNGSASLDQIHNPNLINFLPIRSDDIKILGVCFWLADKFDFDVSGIRILFVAATIFAIGSPVVIYFILYLVKPSQY